MEQQIHKNTEDVRAGETPHVVRYVLAASLGLVAFGMAVILLWGYGVS